MADLSNISELIVLVIMFLSFKVLNKASKLNKSKAFKYLAYGFLFQVLCVLISIITAILGFIILGDQMEDIGELIITVISLAALILSAIFFLLGYKHLKIENNV